MAAAKKAAAMGRPAPARSTKRSASPPPLLPENLLAWELLMEMHDQVEVVGGFGVSVIGFRLEALRFLFDVMVPTHRRAETFWKWRILKPYALRVWSGRDGRNGKGTDDPASRSRRR